MRIAYTHNVQRRDSEDEAEFDTPATIAHIVGALRALGHEVVPIDVAGPVAALVAQIEDARPDLVFNGAEGAGGRFREAFVPALLERMCLPFTGSDAYLCALTMDKRLTKLVLEGRGVPMARDVLVHRPDDLDRFDLPYPVIVKPNFEGSSMGINRDSVVDGDAELRTRVTKLLPRYPEGLLVEEYVVGRDVAVPFLARASPGTCGVLEPIGYVFDVRQLGPRKYPIYDLELKTSSNHALEVEIPARISTDARERVMSASHVVVAALGVRDLGRMDFRVRENGTICFLEVNALPSLEPGAGIYGSAALAGLHTTESVLDAIVRSAAERHGL